VNLATPDRYASPAFLRWLRPGATLRKASLEFNAARKRKKPEIKYGFSFKRLHAEQVAFAMVGDAIVHHAEPRWLTLQEMLRLSGFPIDYPLEPMSAENQGHLIGRGVLPPVGAWLAAQVASGLERNRPAVPGVEEHRLFTAPGSVTVLS
jgi:site-specific DNA-cytosine methylase